MKNYCIEQELKKSNLEICDCYNLGINLNKTYRQYLNKKKKNTIGKYCIQAFFTYRDFLRRHYIQHITKIKKIVKDLPNNNYLKVLEKCSNFNFKRKGLSKKYDLEGNEERRKIQRILSSDPNKLSDDDLLVQLSILSQYGLGNKNMRIRIKSKTKKGMLEELRLQVEMQESLQNFIDSQEIEFEI